MVVLKVFLLVELKAEGTVDDLASKSVLGMAYKMAEKLVVLKV